MILLETIKRAPQKGKGPNGGLIDLQSLVRKRNPVPFRFKDDGLIPNHPRWPLIIYRGAFRLPSGLDPAAVFEQLFDSYGWEAHGATASTTMPTIIRASMKSLASRAGAPGCRNSCPHPQPQGRRCCYPSGGHRVSKPEGQRRSFGRWGLSGFRQL